MNEGDWTAEQSLTVRHGTVAAVVVLAAVKIELEVIRDHEVDLDHRNVVKYPAQHHRQPMT